MIKNKLKIIKDLDNKSKKLSMKDIKFVFIYSLFLAVFFSFIIKNIFLIPFSFLGLVTFSSLYYYFNNKQFKENRKLIVNVISQIEETEDSLFRVLFNKEENFELMKELLSSNKVDKDEVEELYINLSKKDYENINIAKYIETYEYLNFLLEVKEKKSILEDIEDHIEDAVRKPFMKRLDQIKNIFKSKPEIKKSNIKGKNKKMVIKKL
jgi:hypothetical protein